MINWKFWKKKHPTDEVKPLRTEKVSYKHRRAKQNKYDVEMIVTHKGAPLRKFTATMSGYSRDQVAKKAQEEFGIKLASVVQIKPSKK